MNRLDLASQQQHPVYQLVALLEELGEAVLVVDRQAQLVHLSLSAQRMLGVLGADVRGVALSVWMEEFAAVVNVADALDGYTMIPGGGRRDTTVTLRPEEGMFPIPTGFVACRTELNDETVYVCLLRDLSEINRIETQMLDAQRLVRSILQNTTEGYLLIDASGMIMDVNPAFEAICGRNAIDLLEHHFNCLFDENNRIAMEALLERLDKGRSTSAEICFQRADGSQILGLFKGALLFDARNERVGVFGLITDITESKLNEVKIEQLAFYDPLTELANRTLLRDKLEQAIVLSQRSERKFALLFLDLDRFKHVNDTFTHLYGDQLLQQVAQRIQQVVRRTDVVARFGGDEFVVCLLEPRRVEDAALVAEKILQEVAKPFHIGDQILHVTTSIGISVFPDDAISVDELTRTADLAMYQAKEEGRARYSYFTESLNARVRKQREIERQMRLAVDREEFVLYYQPKVAGGSGRIVGAEALIRWCNPELGMVSPADFIPLAEEIGMIVTIGGWVLREASRQLLDWKRQGLMMVPIAVNVSGVQLHHADFRAQIHALATQSEDVTKWLELEITESTLMRDVEFAISLLEDLRAQGFMLSIDDFGTGYSSFSYLTRFPISTLKIDQSFVKDLPHSENAVSIVSAIAGMAQSLGLKTVAEGVETREQAQYLTELGCDQLQGYYYSRPVPAEEFARLLQQQVIVP